MIKTYSMKKKFQNSANKMKYKRIFYSNLDNSIGRISEIESDWILLLTILMID
jgi:hypothetical protein